MGKVAYVVVGLLCSVGAWSQSQGIMPGEPDPNMSPRQERELERFGLKDRTLIDDRKPCILGMRRFTKMSCVPPSKAKPQCEHPTLVTECRRSAKKMKCKEGELPYPVLKCK